MVIRRLAQVVQLLAVVAFLAFGVLLFANEPTLLTAPAAGEVASGDNSPTPEPADVSPPAAGEVATTDESSAGEQVDDADDGIAAGAATTIAPPIDAGSIYADRCSSCHGSAGGGGIGPALADGRVAAAFPDIEDQVIVVREGRGRMPSFGNRLTEDEIRSVVRFTRTL